MPAMQLDENLIIRMANGDGAAFKELYERTSPAVYGFALSILRNTHDAEDVMHDTYIKAYTGAVTYKPMGKPLSWILTIVRNLCYNKIRSNRICDDISMYENVVRAESGVDAADRIALEKAMDILDADERQIVVLHALTGMKHREIAEILDLPAGTVMSKYSRAIKKMRKEIEGKGEA